MKNYQWAMSYIRKIKLGYILGLVYLIAETLSSLAAVSLQRHLIDAFTRQDYELLPVVILGIGLCYVVYASLFTISAVQLMKNVLMMQKSLSLSLLNHLYHIPIAKFQRERTGSYVHYFSNDTSNVAQFLGRGIPIGIQQIVTAVALIIFVGMASPIILFAVTILSLVYIWLGKYFSTRLKNASRDVQERKKELLIHTEEGISSTREVIAYHRLEWEKKNYNNKFNTYYDAVISEGKMINRKIFLSDPILWASNLGILAVGGYQVFLGNLSIGLFVVTYQFASQLMGSYRGIYEFIMKLSSSTETVERLKKVLSEEQVSEGIVLLSTDIRTVEFRNVSFGYSENTGSVLQQFNVSFPIGSKIALVGSSGGGKSTVAQLLIRFFDPNNGNILVNGTPLGDIQRDYWMRKVSIVFQEPYLFPDTIRNNLVMGLHDISDEHIVAACKKAEIHNYIESLPEGYLTEIGERGITLSGGQRQRLAIARAILRNTELLILDEATSALDLETELVVQQNIDEVRKGKTTIVIAHRLSTIQNANMIFVLDKGCVVEYGTHAQLLTKGNIYPQLVRTQYEAISVS